MRWTALIVVLLLAVACSTGNDSDSTQTAGIADIKAEPVPTDTALMLPGDAGDGSVVMVNGRAIRPAGSLVQVHDFPSCLQVLPDGDVAVVSMRSKHVNIIDGDAFSVIGEAATGSAFVGLTANAAGDTLYVSGGAKQVIYEFALTAGTPTLIREIPTFGFPLGVALTPDESTLLVASSYGQSVYFIDLSTGENVGQAIAGIYPYDIEINAVRNEAFVSNWGGSSVTVVDLDDMEAVAEITVGQHPEGMVLSPDGNTLYVTDADSDTVSVVDVADRELIATYDIYNAQEIVGGSPVDIAVSDDGDTLYVAAAGLNAVVVLDADDGGVLGMIPTGYYPSAVALDEATGVLYVANGKGGGIPALNRKGVSMTGTVEQIDLPDNTQLADYTQTVMDNLTRTELYWETMEFESPIPTERGVPSQQIKRVVFIMRENKTFDQELSDLDGVNGDPAHLVFGRNNTPNTHALAEMFTNCDNYYSEANASVQGHMWSTMMYSNDYVEKCWASKDRTSMSGVEPAAIGGNKTIFHHLMNNDVKFRVYGQVVGTLSDIGTLAPYIDFKYGFWNLGISDEIKADEIIREMEGGIWPEFVYISLHNDHTNGSDAGQPTVQFYVGDNDAGLGKIIDYITHSEYWNETAIFITEDDPQSGSDHVDPHRSIGLVISPWAKHGYVSNVLYSMSSIWMTIQMILGIPPMTVYDEHTSPMYDCFTMTPDYSTYDALPNNIPLEYNPDDLPMAAYSSKQNWGAPDQVRRLGEVVWSIMRPGEKFPAHMSVDSYVEDDEEEDETEEAQEYREVADALKAYALEHGLWDGSTLPTIPRPER